MAALTIDRRSLAAEVRAVEAGRIARAQDDGSFLVRSEDGARSYRVTFYSDNAGDIHLTCTCAWGEHHPGARAGCKHIAAAGRSLVRRELAIQDAQGLFIVPSHPGAPEVLVDDTDPFAGLPR